jgi:hypothetical protein
MPPSQDPQLTSAETVASSRPVSQTSAPSSYTSDEGRFVPGTLLNGRYRISNLLGRGGMGEVYRATDLTLGQSVALKFLPESASGNIRLLERFHGEVRVARQVSHPNVCRVHDIGEVDGSPFISMEYVDGEDLASLLQRIGRLPADKAIEIGRKICAGLAAAHDKGVIHRDLKPQNIMLNKRGEVLIMDFGLAAVADSLTGPEAFNGTPAYMSTEQLKGLEVTAKSDIYSLGAVLFELFTGKRPFEAKTVQAMIDMQESQTLTGGFTAGELDTAAERVIRRCLNPDPEKRPQSALAVSAALPGGDPLAAALAAGETPSPEMVADAGRRDGLPLKWALACLGIVVTCLLVAPFVRSSRLALAQAPMKFPPAVLELKAREAAHALGYTRDPGDSSFGFSNRPALLRFLQERLPHDRWKPSLQSEGALSFGYRESPAVMIAWPIGELTSTNPPMLTPGMTAVQLDSFGQLREFTGVPYDGQDPAMKPIAPDAVFRAAGLDITKFQEAEAKSLPKSATDTTRAWQGTHPGIPEATLKVEIGWWKNQITMVKVIWPWMDERGGTSPPQSFWSKIRFVLVTTFAVLGTAFACLLARRNWRRGRVDRIGALRLAGFQFVLSLSIWAGNAHLAPSTLMFDLFWNAISNALLPSAILWILHLALEPELRARWPQSIVTWNRLLAGRFGDPQVASHILIGATAGLAMWVTMNLLMQQAQGSGLDQTNVFVLNGPRSFLTMVAVVISEGLQMGMIGFLILFGVRMLVRKDWIALIVVALLFAAVEKSLALANQWQLRYAMYVLAYLGLAFLMSRTGMVASVTTIIFVNLTNHALIATDWTAWHASMGLTMCLLIFALAAAAFWKSLGSRELLGDCGPAD